VFVYQSYFAGGSSFCRGGVSASFELGGIGYSFAVFRVDSEHALTTSPIPIKPQIPLVDDLTHMLIEVGKKQITVMQPYRGYFIAGSALLVHPFYRNVVTLNLILNAEVKDRMAKTVTSIASEDPGP